MHELSLATSLSTQLLRIAAEQRATRIVAVEVVCGEMQQVVPEALRLAFEVVMEGTVAAGAELTITEERLAARCRACGHHYHPTIVDFLCPACQAADAELIGGRDIVLKSVVCETAEQVSTHEEDQCR